MTKKAAAIGSAIGKSGGSVLGAAVDRAKTVAGSVEQAAGPIIEQRLAQAKAIAEPMAKSSTEHAKLQTKKFVEAALPIAERGINRAAAFIIRHRS